MNYVVIVRFSRIVHENSMNGAMKYQSMSCTIDFILSMEMVKKL